MLATIKESLRGMLGIDHSECTKKLIEERLIFKKDIDELTQYHINLCAEKHAYDEKKIRTLKAQIAKLRSPFKDLKKLNKATKPKKRADK